VAGTASAVKFSATDARGSTQLKGMREHPRESVACGVEERRAMADCAAKRSRESILKAFGPWGKKGVNELQFRIQGQDYFLAFFEQEKRWYVFAPTAQGVRRIPVYAEAVKGEKPGVLGTETTLSS
jgi:hypothetical protein